MTALNWARAVRMARFAARSTNERMAVRGIYRAGRWKYVAVHASTRVVRR